MTIKKINRSMVISVSSWSNLIFHKRLFLRTLWKQVCVDKQRTHYFLKIRMYISKGRMKSSNRSSFSKEFWKDWERRHFEISTSRPFFQKFIHKCEWILKNQWKRVRRSPEGILCESANFVESRQPFKSWSIFQKLPIFS